MYVKNLHHVFIGGKLIVSDRKKLSSMNRKKPCRCREEAITACDPDDRSSWTLNLQDLNQRTHPCFSTRLSRKPPPRPDRHQKSPRLLFPNTRPCFLRSTEQKQAKISTQTCKTNGSFQAMTKIGSHAGAMSQRSRVARLHLRKT
jgi:hypothetical protein